MIESILYFLKRITLINLLLKCVGLKNVFFYQTAKFEQNIMIFHWCSKLDLKNLALQIFAENSN